MNKKTAPDAPLTKFTFICAKLLIAFSLRTSPTYHPIVSLFSPSVIRFDYRRLTSIFTMPRRHSPDSGGVVSSSSSEDEDGREYRRSSRGCPPKSGELPARERTSANQRRGTTPVHQRLGKRPTTDSTNRGTGRGSGRSHARDSSRRPPPPPSWPNDPVHPVRPSKPFRLLPSSRHRCRWTSRRQPLVSSPSGRRWRTSSEKAG